ncbi:MAG: HNH endonuclease signature motif containing protein [Ethanoligenens sp.]
MTTIARPFAEYFYKSKRWRKCRDGFMQSRHFICERCGQRATVAHHKVHIIPDNINDPGITLSWDNLQALCADCHAKVHGNGTGVPDGYAFDAEGNMVRTE